MLEYYGHNDFRDYHLAHHGVLGMRWGIRRYQPYGMGYDPKGEDGKFIGGKKKAISNQSSYQKKETVKVTTKNGFKVKARVMSEDEDMRSVNKIDVNDPGTFNNCTYCGAAYEMRRRGYDVKAKKTPEGVTTLEEMKWYNAKLDDYSSLVKMPKTPIGVHLARNKAFKGENLKQVDAAVNQLLSQGEGARGCLHLVWGNKDGHVVNYEVKNHNVIVRDSQSGRKESASSILRYSIAAYALRTDDKELDFDAIKEAVEDVDN